MAKLPGSITARKGSSNLYYRRSLPRHVRHLFGNRAEVWQSLGTSDRREAAARVTEVAVALQRRIDGAAQLSPITADDVKSFSKRYYEQELRDYELVRQNLPSDRARAEAEPKLFRKDLGEQVDGLVVLEAGKDYIERRRILRATLQQHFQTGVHVIVADVAAALLNESGKIVDEESPMFRSLCDSLMRARMEALDITFERDAGNYAGTPRDPALVTAATASSDPASVGQTTLGELFEGYVAANARKLAPGTVKLYRDVVRLFRERVGVNAGPSAMIKKNVRDWRNDLQHWPTKAAQRREFEDRTFPEIIQQNRFLKFPTVTDRTIRKYLSAIGAFSSWLVFEGYIDHNPVNNLYPDAGPSTNPRRSFDDSELQSLVEIVRGQSEGKTCNALSESEHHAERVWAPVIAMFSGARMTEILQLRPHDICERDGIAFFNFTEEDEDGERASTSLKTKASQRAVPVHSKLIELGFLSFVQKAKKQARQRLFPDVRVDASGSMSGPFSKWINKALRSSGVRKGVVFHSLRHTVADAIRSHGGSETDAAMILGHAIPGEARLMTKQYGEITAGTLAARKTIVERINYPSLDWNGLNSTDDETAQL